MNELPAALLAVSRNGIVERIERGHAVIVDSLGEVLWSVGETDHVTYMRSSAKPMQATAMLLSGAVDRFGLPDSSIAVACGSHRGEARHVKTVLSTLSRIGLGPESLACGSHELRHAEGYRLASAGLAPSPLHNNCSGKHSGMLAATMALGAPTDTYLSREHPVQKCILDVVAQCAGVAPGDVHVGTDGCSAPTFALPMAAIARCFATVGQPEGLPPPIRRAFHHVGDAMQSDPWLVAGTGQFDSLLMAACPGAVIAKGGAEGLRCVSLGRRGLGIAVKVESGNTDSASIVMLAILRALGVVEGISLAILAPFNRPLVRNHRQIEVGRTDVTIDQELEALSSLNLYAQ